MKLGVSPKVLSIPPTSFQGAEISEEGGPKQSESKMCLFLLIAYICLSVFLFSFTANPRLGVYRTNDHSVTH